MIKRKAKDGPTMDTLEDNHNSLSNKKIEIPKKCFKYGDTENRRLIMIEINGKISYVFAKKSHDPKEVKANYERIINRKI